MIEEEIARLYHEQKMRCPVHLSIGQECNAVAIASCLHTSDHMVSTHRGHAHYLAKGGSLLGLLGELYGKEAGCSRGYGGSMHLTDRSVGFLASTSIVGGTVPIGVGSAFSAKLLGIHRLSVVCIGDAAIEEGVFHESANFASLHNLPVIFFLENNNYSCFTSRDQRQPKRVRGLEDVAMAHGLDFLKVRWPSFADDVAILQSAVRNLRIKSKPLLVECDAYRFVEHCGPNPDDHLNYRPEEEIKTAQRLDPLLALEEDLLQSKLLSDIDILNFRNEVKKEIAEAREKLPLGYSLKGNPEKGKYLYAEIY